MLERRTRRKGEAMREPVWSARRVLVGAVLVAGVVGCGGGSSKPPMVPDAPDPAVTGDAGAPAPASPPSSAGAAKK
jgi:hypothetical protein